MIRAWRLFWWRLELRMLLIKRLHAEGAACSACMGSRNDSLRRIMWGRVGKIKAEIDRAAEQIEAIEAGR